MAPTPVAEFRNASKVYASGWPRRSRLVALDNVNLQLEAGLIHGLLGPNRAGKTTLVKLLLSLCRPTRGTVLRFREPVAVRHTLGRIGYVHENQTFPHYLTPTTMLELYGALGLVPPDLVRHRAPQLLQRVGLADRAHDSLGTFSKGMLQRAALAQALINAPDLLVLDEPTEGLDLSGRQLIHDILREHRAKGGTVLLISHLHAEIEQLCDRVIVLAGGQVRFEGAPAELARRSRPEPGNFQRALSQMYEAAGA